MFHADLHIHSKFSRACSRDCDIPHLAAGAWRKGITVVGTGDFTHPAWAAELKETLVPAEPGLLRLRPDLERNLRLRVPAACNQPVRFMLSVEISTIYRRSDRTRKVHHLIYAPSFEAADRITAALSRIGNLASDGRPILGLDSRDLLEITLEGGPGCYLVPAHIWTPWFAVLGSRSGFDAVADCYDDLAGEIFAVETGLSSDPSMNWMCSSLDGYRLVSNSDAHSPPMLGREATTFSAAMDYFSIAEALRTGDGLAGTIEFYPEEGKYHLDGHRKCGIRFDPQQTRAQDGVCPECHKPLTVGVLHRVAELADRPDGYRPDGAAGFNNLVQLPEIVGEILSVGPKSKSVYRLIDRLVAAFGPELSILQQIPADDLARVGGSALGEAIGRLRRGEVIRDAGYDGEYGHVRLFQPGELDRAEALFDLPEPAPAHPGQKLAPDAGPGAGLTAGPTAGPGAEPTAGPTAGLGAGLAAGLGAGPAVGPGASAGSTAAPQDPTAPSDSMTSSDSVTTSSPAAPAAPAPSAASPSDGGVAALLDGLDDEQRAAVTTPAGAPLMVIAGPGTGKTRALTHRIAYQAAAERRPAAQFLAVTFTRRAAGEMRDRLAGLAVLAESDVRAGLGGPRGANGSGDPAAATVTTFHGLALRLLTEYAKESGLPEDVRVADEAGRLEAAIRVAGSDRDGRRLLTALATGEPARPEQQPEFLARQAAFRAELALDGLLDVDELITRAVQLLGDHPDALATLRERWPRISVDEYQDVDERQYELLRLLAGPGAGLTVIGDPDQAIYGFRGADVGFFLRFGADYPGARTVHLTRNYRSSPTVVKAAVQAIAPATLVPDRRLDARGRPGHPGTAAIAGPPIVAGPPVVVHEAASEQAEGTWIAAEIDRLIGGSSFHSLDTGRTDSRQRHTALGLSDVAVLYRTDAQTAPLLQALNRAGLPAQKGSHDRLARRPGVRELVRELRLATPGADLAGQLRTAVSRLTALTRGAQSVDILTAGEVLAPLAGRCGDDLEQFLTEISLGAEADAQDPRADAVTLLTLHAAKGLEFEVVFIAGCERGLLPLQWPGSAPSADTAEERRLLFVGMTRARSRLLLSYAASRGRGGAASPASADGPGRGRSTGASPFLASIDPALLSRAETARRPAPDRQLRLL
ncbi:MAG TPA: UvrD-helicase domain-containing protein [Streptosporangiaceae bacterium]